MRQVPLSQIRPGHHPDAPAGVVNVRHAGRDAGLDILGASILSLGLLQPLVVVPGGDFFYVVDGNRRHAALEALLAAGKLPLDAEVHHYGRTAPSTRPSAMALMGALDTDAMATALEDAFDGEAFFKAVPKGVILSIVEEVLGEAEARRVKDFKKAELVAFAVASVLPTGWLPAEIRHPGYVGPGAAIEAEPQAIAA